MLPEYGLTMAVVRSTSAALYICDTRRTTCSDRSENGSKQSTTRHDGDKTSDRRHSGTGLKIRSAVNDIVDILCYVWYLPLFFAGPLMTYENFHQQVCMLASIARLLEITKVGRRTS